ncbi:MAG: hypothetical protein QGG54_16560 [Gammaproteobacteria bacterium]|jgi:hypothetical protein|nr:hypothetical protein [Gammaproteobacteria bacterium]MDP6652395.1 hypothetical protein [Gammaproteobacteria bacterium]
MRHAEISPNGRAGGQRSYLREGFNVVERIQEIVETLDNPEVEAMAKLYVADFQLLMRERRNMLFGGRLATTTRGNSSRTYRDAMEMLQEAGVDQAKIDAFFQRPVVLPVSEYYLSLDAAMAQQAATGYAVNTSEEGESSVTTVHMGDFIAWNESLPFAHRPATPELIEPLSEELISVSLRFTINSVGKSRAPVFRRQCPTPPGRAMMRRMLFGRCSFVPAM